jgi:hypothetical protein
MKAALDQLGPMAKSQVRLCFLVGDFGYGAVMWRVRPRVSGLPGPRCSLGEFAR